jgi:amidase
MNPKLDRREIVRAAGAAALAAPLGGALAGAVADQPGVGAAGAAPDYRTARELVAALRAGQTSAVELAERAIACIEAHDGTLNAVVVRDFARARAAAQAADRALAAGERRPLLGVPMTVKEAFNVAGLPTTWGVPGTEHLAVREDAVAVRRLKAAGAVLLGKTNVPLMLADWQSYNAVYGTTNNPWDLGRTPGGSSGGGAAALAAGYVSLEFGSDIAGSLRAPAHFCGVFAHKPTSGLVPARGLLPPGAPALSVGVAVDLMVAGPLARSAGDLALALDVTAGPDDAEATAYRLALPAPRHAELKDFRVLVLDRHPLLPTSEAVRAALDRMADGLRQAGCTVATAAPLLPDLALIGRTYMRLLMAFAGADFTPDRYRRMQSLAAALAPDDRSLMAERVRASTMSHADWIAADRMRVGIAHQWRQFFRDTDVVICPVMPTTAFPHDHGDMEARSISIDGRDVRYADQSVWAGIATLTGLPATAMPIGRGPDGLPIGMQIIGPYLEDRTPLAFAELAEREFGGFVAPPPPAQK